MKQMKQWLRRCRALAGLLLLAVMLLAQSAMAPQTTAAAASQSGTQSRYELTRKKKKKNKNKNKNKKSTESSSQADTRSDDSSKSDDSSRSGKNETESEAALDEDGSYTSREDVAAYLHEYGHLPDNFITKNEARDLGWVSSEGNLDEVAPGKSIGGDRFGNYEGLLPEKNGRTYYECDIDYDGGYRSSKRIIYSNDGLIYYTEDHYETFTQLYDADGPVKE